MTINQSKVPEGHVRLMTAIGDAIRLHTMTSPMRADEVVGILAFCAGAGIANAPSHSGSKRELRQMAVANIDNAMQAFGSAPKPSSGLILPSTLQ